MWGRRFSTVFDLRSELYLKTFSIDATSIFLKILVWKGGSSEPIEPLLPTPLKLTVQLAASSLWYPAQISLLRSLCMGPVLSVTSAKSHPDCSVDQWITRCDYFQPCFPGQDLLAMLTMINTGQHRCGNQGPWYAPTNCTTSPEELDHTSQPCYILWLPQTWVLCMLLRNNAISF